LSWLYHLSRGYFQKYSMRRTVCKSLGPKRKVGKMIFVAAVAWVIIQMQFGCRAVLFCGVGAKGVGGARLRRHATAAASNATAFALMSVARDAAPIYWCAHQTVGHFAWLFTWTWLSTRSHHNHSEQQFYQSRSTLINACALSAHLIRF
jgi:hypothetical protein